MPAPTGTFQRPDLGLLFEQFDLEEDLGYIATQVFPIFDTARQTANYSVESLATLLQDADLSRAMGGGYKRTDHTFTQDSFATKEYGSEEPIDDRERQIYTYSFDIEMIAAQRLRARIERNLEIQVATAVQTAGTYGANTTTAATKWNSVSVAAPVDDVRAALIALRASSGLNPRMAIGVCDWELAEYLKDSEQILQRIKYSGRDEVKRGDITYDMLAKALGLRALIVGGAVKNTADKGQTASLSSVWDRSKFAILHVATSNDLRKPCFGRTFAWAGDGANATGVMEEYREEQSRSQIIRCRSEFQAKVMYASAGYLLTSCYA